MTYDATNIFARILRGEADAHRVHEDAATLVIMDAMPQSDGHALILSKAAAENLYDLDPGMAGTVMRMGQRVALAARRAFKPAGVALMQFNGAEAGQTVFHFHLHVIPRYTGQPLRAHGRGFADPAVLADHALRLRAALNEV